MDNIFCHIAGLNNNMKDQIKKILTNQQFEIIDLDLLSEIVTKENTLDKLYCEYENINDCKNKESKEIEKKMTEYWKTRVSELLDEKVTKVFNKLIIVVGMNTHFKNPKINFKINTKLKFFVKLDIIKNAKKIISHNLDNHRDDIINGLFPLEYLQIDFLVKKRNNLINIYKKQNYELKPILLILKIISNNINFNVNQIDDIYCASTIKQDKRIKYNDSRIIGYSIPWLAAVACLKSKNINKGLKNNEGFVKEIINNGFDDLNNECYIYKVDKEHFYNHEQGKNIKFGTTNNVKILENYHITNIYKYLQDNDIKLIK